MNSGNSVESGRKGSGRAKCRRKRRPPDAASTWKPRGHERVVGTHRFDCDRDDVRNNERGRGQERGCDLTSTSQLNFVIITVHNVHLYVYVACPYLYCLYVESVRCLPFVWASGSLEMACSRLTTNITNIRVRSGHAYFVKAEGVARGKRICNPVIFGDVFSGKHCASEMPVLPLILIKWVFVQHSRWFYSSTVSEMSECRPRGDLFTMQQLKRMLWLNRSLSRDREAIGKRQRELIERFQLIFGEPLM
jgi:hypothetical protein